MSRVEFALPDVGEGLDKGVVLAWQVAEGDAVKVDQIIAEVETDKAIVEIPAPVSGTIVHLGAAPGETLAVGEILAIFDTVDGQSVPAAPPPSGTEAPQNAALAAPVAPPTPGSRFSATPAGRPARVLASPATRKLARSLGVDLGTVAGTGSRGQVTRADVEAAGASGALPTAENIASLAANAPTTHSTNQAASAPVRRAAPPRARSAQEDTVEPLSGLRRQIAINMEAAWRTIPHIFTLEELDATGLVAARRALNEDLASEGRRLSYLPFFVKACVAALESHPRFNATLDMDNEQVIYHQRINVGIATATPDGLIVTVVHDADQKSLVDIASDIDQLAALARERRVTVDQIRGGTFTISNYGSYGAWMGTPIIRPPEVAIAGFGRIQDTVVPVDGQPAVRPSLPMVISTDHRLNDGEHLGQFMQTLMRYLSEPVRLLAR